MRQRQNLFLLLLSDLINPRRCPVIHPVLSAALHESHFHIIVSRADEILLDLLVGAGDGGDNGDNSRDADDYSPAWVRKERSLWDQIP